jgi:putative endonuclease
VTDGAFLYIVRCADGSYYTGTARCGLEQRMAEHNAGHFPGYTSTRRPVVLVFSAERQVKGWSRAKKEALMRGDFEGLRRLSKRMGSHPSRRPPAAGSSG